MTEKNPKVFISYCQESLEFSDRVLNFSNKLRSEGIDTILDQYEESPKEGWPRWMVNSINESDYIIVICTQEYLKRLMGKTDKGIGKGVKWESNIIYQHLYNDDSLNERFIPVIFHETDTKFIPMPLQGATYYDISKPERYERLYWRLRGVNKKEKPQLGKLRPLPEKERKSLFITTPIDLETWDKAIWRGAAFLMDTDNSEPPCLILPYKNEYYATKIFKNWISMYGKEDKHDEIRVAIIEGDIPGEEKGYTIHISSNIDRVAKRMEEQGLELDESLIMSISRMQRANPTDNFKMFNMFKARYQKHKKYILMPAVIDETSWKIKPLFEYGLLKHELIFKHVSEIDEHDLDAPVILKNKPWKKY
ncbi:TIR domain-containing protein [Brevibacillus gelatini]|uniref:TIR domain-containing protein n=1 Tax=Brevibacillus TaxID=55080 RepID=UPI00363BB9A3